MGTVTTGFDAGKVIILRIVGEKDKMYSRLRELAPHQEVKRKPGSGITQPRGHPFDHHEIVDGMRTFINLS